MTATQWFEVLATYSLHVFVLIAVCRLLERALVRPDDLCAIWNLAFLCVLSLGAAAVLLPRLRLFQPWSSLEPKALLTIGTTQVTIARCLLTVWCVGAAISFLRWIVRASLLRRTLRRCQQLPADEVQRLLRLTNVSWGEKETLTLLISDEADGPFCWQIHRPIVVLPRFLLDENSNDLRHALLHELEHLNTSHPSQLFWQHVAQVVCWFHPSVGNASSRASLAREYMCDEAAAQQGADSAAYLRTLLHIAERFKQKQSRSAIGLVRTPSEIALRARRLLALARQPIPRRPTSGLSRKTAVWLLLVVTCLLHFVNLPLDSLASKRSFWSPWPTWSAKSLYCFGIKVRDYEQFDRRTRLFEMAHHLSPRSSANSPVSADAAGSD